MHEKQMNYEHEIENEWRRAPEHKADWLRSRTRDRMDGNYRRKCIATYMASQICKNLFRRYVN